MATVLDIVLPVFGLIGLGYGLARTGILGERARDGLSDFVFVVAIPALLFRTVAEARLPPGLPWDYWIAYFSGVVVVWVLGMLAAHRVFGRDAREAALFGMITGQANTVFVGLPLILRAYGDAAAVPIAYLLAIHLPITMTAVTLLVERAAARDSGAGTARRLARALATHPILLALAAGGLARLAGYAPGGPIKAAIDALAATTVPSALVATGLALAAYGTAKELAPAGVLSVLKLAVHPLVVWLLATFVFALDPVFAGAAVLFAASPCGIQAFMVAQRYGVAVATASTALALSTVLAVATTSGWLFVLLR